MKRFFHIKNIALASLLLISMLIASFAMTSCGDSRPKTEVPEELKSDERKKVREDISEEDRAAYIAKLDEYVSYLNGDYSVIEDLYPEDYWEQIGSTPEEIVEMQKASEENNRARAEETYGKGYKITYEIESEKNYEPLLVSLKSTLKENFGIDPERVSKAYNIYINLTMKGPKNSGTESFYLIPVNIDGNWYLVNESGGFN